MCYLDAVKLQTSHTRDTRHDDTFPYDEFSRHLQIGLILGILLATNFLTKVAQMFGDFLAILKNVTF